MKLYHAFQIESLKIYVTASLKFEIFSLEYTFRLNKGFSQFMVIKSVGMK